MAGTILQNWTLGSVEMHIAITNSMILRRGFFETLFAAAFGDSRPTAYAVVGANNERSLKLCRHTGLVDAGRIPNGYAPGEDLVLLVIERGNCRYLEENRDG